MIIYRCDFRGCEEQTGRRLPSEWAAITTDDGRGCNTAGPWHFCSLHSPMHAFRFGAEGYDEEHGWIPRDEWEEACSATALRIAQWLSSREEEELVDVAYVAHALNVSRVLVVDAVRSPTENPLVERVRLVSTGSFNSVRLLRGEE